MTLVNVFTQLDDVAELIANPNPDRPFENAVGTSGRLVCDSLGNIPDWAVNFAGIASGIPALGLLRQMCAPYYNKNGFDGPELAPPFSGGQCPGVTYQISWVRNIPGSPPSSQSIQRTGPLSISEALGPGESNVVCPPGLTFARTTLISPQGNVNLASGCGTSATNIVVTRIDGLPDDCGNLDGELSPGNNRPPNPGNLPVLLIPTINADGDLVFGVPPSDPGGGFPPIELPDDLLGQPSPEPVASPGGDTSPGDPESVGGSAGTTPDGGGEIDFGTPPPGRAWVGAFIRIDVPEAYGSIPKAAGNNTAFPRVLGNASLKFGPSRTSTAVRITSEETDLFRPHPTLEVTGTIVNCSPGITATAFPVSAEICPESQCTSE